jgi:hypothetical protein
MQIKKIMTNVLVSVCMTTYNNEKFIGQALDGGFISSLLNVKDFFKLTFRYFIVPAQAGIQLHYWIPDKNIRGWLFF